MEPEDTESHIILIRRSKRLERKISDLKTISWRYSMIRLAVVILGALIVWITSTVLKGRWGWYAFITVFIPFIVLVWRHRNLERWMRIFQIWHEIYREKIARLNLDWSNIPAYKTVRHDERSPLAVDLDLTGKKSLHHLLDTSVSIEGSQLLADWLTHGNPRLDEIQERQQLVSELIPYTYFRLRLQLAFRHISAEVLSGARISEGLCGSIPSRTLIYLSVIASIILFINTTLFLLNIIDLIPAYWILTTGIFLVFYLSSAGRLKEYMEAIVRMEGEIDKFRSILVYLEGHPFQKGTKLANLCAPFHDPQNPPSKQMVRLKLITAAIGLRMNPVVGILLNLALPWDYVFALLALRCQNELSQSLQNWLEIWYRLEALISLATFAELNPAYEFPKISEDCIPVFQAKALGHPLILRNKRVCNDFTIGELGQIVIITGSNMAGKSTFIKTVGINLCLAYAGGPVNATSFSSRPFRIHTCIKISDSLTEGYSYFYAEVKCLKELILKLDAKESFPLLYLVDEIYRGTNNRERLAGSAALINKIMGKTGVGFLATHDLDLATQCENINFAKQFHFRDQVSKGKLLFDYKIRPGISPTTNALLIMKEEGLPT